MTLKVVNDDVRKCTNLDNDFVAYPYGTYPLAYANPEWYSRSTVKRVKKKVK